MFFLIPNTSIIMIFLAGAAGAFISDILNDNCIELPKRVDGKLFLGGFGGLIVGGIAGLLIDGSLITAFMGGFTGKAIIVSLLNKYQ
jgi:hypothetical protein